MAEKYLESFMIRNVYLDKNKDFSKAFLLVK